MKLNFDERFRGNVARFLWLLMLPVIALSIWLQERFAGIASRVPLPMEGRIYEFHAHGSIVYLNKLEYFVSEYLFWIGVLCGMAGAAISQSLQKVVRR